MKAGRIRVLEWWPILILALHLTLILSFHPSSLQAQMSPVYMSSWGTLGWSIALAGDGSIIVADVHEDTVTRYSGSGEILGRWGTRGSGPGEFMNAAGIAVGPDGSIYITDDFLHRVQKFSPGGEFITSWGRFGDSDGEFYAPNAISVSADHHVFVCDRGNSRVQEFTSAGEFVGEIGVGTLINPMGVSISSAGEIFVTDRMDEVSVYNRKGEKVRGWGGEGESAGRFKNPVAISATGGLIYVVDRLNHRIQAFTMDGSFAFAWGQQGSGEGEFLFPTDVVATSSGLVYVADGKNSRVQVFEIGVPVIPTTWSQIKLARSTRK